MTLPPAIEAFVRDARVARLATVDEAGRPHVVPVCFVYAVGAVFSVLDEKPKRVPVERLRRVRNLIENPNVQLLVDRYDEDWTRLAYVQLRGRAGLLREGETHAAALAALRQKYPQYRDMRLEEAPMIRVAVEGYVAWGAGLE
ncbi:MAG TPA: TIGR03668 family PPOX class F420-dependent oxidoreductase [Dehalococcoidia bacterium]|nr:TIGR03668 family PPOX class F420-dependent oxidoreductase [Dehalococcoidia bacterium]